MEQSATDNPAADSLEEADRGVAAHLRKSPTITGRDAAGLKITFASRSPRSAPTGSRHDEAFLVAVKRSAPSTP